MVGEEQGERWSEYCIDIGSGVLLFDFRNAARDHSTRRKRSSTKPETETQLTSITSVQKRTRQGLCCNHMTHEYLERYLRILTMLSVTLALTSAT